MMSADLGGPHDGALCFNIVHHLTPEQNVALLRRMHDALSPGGTVAVLDLWMPRGRPPPRRRRDAGPVLLSDVVGRDVHASRRARLARGGRLRPARRVEIRRLPGLALFEARRAD